MTYAIFDSSANLVASYDDQETARQALIAIVQREPEAAEDVALLAFDDRGRAVGDALLGTSVLKATL
jgi:hypothetical protein